MVLASVVASVWLARASVAIARVSVSSCASISVTECEEAQRSSSCSRASVARRVGRLHLLLQLGESAAGARLLNLMRRQDELADDAQQRSAEASTIVSEASLVHMLVRTPERAQAILCQCA